MEWEGVSSGTWLTKAPGRLLDQGAVKHIIRTAVMGRPQEDRMVEYNPNDAKLVN